MIHDQEGAAPDYPAMRILLGATLLFGLIFWVYPAEALDRNYYRQGCHDPISRTRLCWEVSTLTEDATAPLKELHILPISQERYPDREVLPDVTRAIYRQLRSANIAERMQIQWQAAVNLDEALNYSFRNGWRATLYIQPRTMRTSADATSGLVDFDAYLIDGQQAKVVRTMRVRLESPPRIPNPGLKNAAGTWAATQALEMVFEPIHYVTRAALIGGAAVGAQDKPPVPGKSLELMTELAVRHIIFMMANPVEEIQPDRDTEAWDKSLASWTGKLTNGNEGIGD